MRILHATAISRSSPGIINQLRAEYLEARRLEIPWEVKICAPAGTLDADQIVEDIPRMRLPNWFPKKVIAMLDWLWLRYRYHKWLKTRTEVDVYILRYSVHDPFQLYFLLTSNKPVCLIHHTLELSELYSEGGFRGKVRFLLEKIMGPITIRVASRVIGVTPEIAMYEINRSRRKDKKVYVFPNGISRDSVAAVEDRRDNRQEWIFVAGSFAPWHGLDRLLHELGRTDADVVLHLVGQLSQEQLDLAREDSRIVLHGLVDRQKIVDISAACWIGLASFGMDRLNMKEACPLKVREYLAMGLPVVAGYDDIFDPGFPFFRRTGHSIDAIIKYAEECRSYKREQIREAALPYIEIRSILRDFYSNMAHQGFD